ncbi:MAG: LacI family DNA-binding transcriptional regulator [Oceanipulchritudo sp.]
MKDIAERAGCSVNTVSRALRGDRMISAGRRAQIRALAEEMGYRPDPLVSALCGRIASRREGKHFQATVALLNPLETVSRAVLLDRMMAAARGRLEERGYHLERFPYAQWRDKGDRFTGMLRARGILGLILLHFPQPRFRLDWDLSGLALVAFGYSLEEPVLHRVADNGAQAIELVLENITRLGYRRPGLVLSSFQHEESHGIRTGMLLVWHHNRRVKDPVPPFTDWMQGIGDPAPFLAWYDAHRPDVLLAHDYRAIELLGRARGLRCPQDVAFVDLNRGASGKPRAGIDINPEGCGLALADLTVAQIQRNERGVPADPRVTLVRPRWIDGPSCPAR